jgi:WLM domain
MQSVLVKYKSSSFAVEYAESETVQEVLSSIQTKLNAEFSHPKLLLKGKILQPGDVASILLPPNSTVMLVASSSKALEQVNTLEDKFKMASQNYQKALLTRPKHAVEVDEYYCHQLETLQLPGSESALKLLHQIRTDFGIRQIMKRRGWNVGKLIEIHPITQHTILGYNQNKGQVIALRLRTDAMDGFRTFDSIRKVMLHELAHMVHAEHAEPFHALNRELNAECDRYHSANKLSSAIGPRFSDAVAGAKSEYVLGGTNRGDTPLRDVLADAAMKRLTKQEQELVDGCGSKGS